MRRFLIVVIFIGTTWMFTSGMVLRTLNDASALALSRDTGFIDWIAGFITGGAIYALLDSMRVRPQSTRSR
jgi:hypothetical protein